MTQPTPQEDQRVRVPYTDLQLDALRELANVASGTAATSLSQLLGREVSMQVPRALALPLADVVQAVGDPEDTVSAVVIPVAGEMEALVLLLIDAGTVAALHRLLGVASEDPIADSALMEAGNILIAAYLNAISVMTGLAIEPTPPELRTDLLATIVASLPVEYSDELDIALVMESELRIAEEACRMSFLLLPGPGGVSDLLSPLGLSEVGA